MAQTKEQARCVLPLGLYSEVYWTTSLQAVAHFIRLRSESHAQWEIQQYAAAVRDLVEAIYPVSLRAMMESEAMTIREMRMGGRLTILVRGCGANAS